MSLSTDLKISERYSSGSAASGSTSVSSSDGSFSQVFSEACQASGETKYEKYFQAAADAYDVPVNLIKAMAKAESGLNARAVSRCGAKGLMQLMPATARSMGVSDPFDPAQNIMGGTKYLRKLLDMFNGDVSKTIAAYNAGPGTIKKYGGVLPSQKKYVSKVLQYADSMASSPAASKTAAPAMSSVTDTKAAQAVSPVKDTKVAPTVNPAASPAAAPAEVPTAAPTVSPASIPTAAPVVSPAGIPAAAPAASQTGSSQTIFVASEPLNQDDLADLIYQVSRSNGDYGQECAQFLIQQIFLQNARALEEQDDSIII